MSILEKIDCPEDLKTLSDAEITALSAEIREFLVTSVAHTGGHLASNLGIVELTIAIHRVFDTSKDRLVFDVGHQSYVHKILTGRKEAFFSLRQKGGLSGFPKPRESVHDAFIAGHASNSISVALGMAEARTRLGEHYHVLALIGDGALTGGLSYEGLSNAGQSGEPLIVILNDNGMAIEENVGGVAQFLSQMRLKSSYLNFKRLYRSTVGRVKWLYSVLHKLKTALKVALLPSSIFEDMGFYYLGPVDGHDEKQVETVLRWAKELKEPVLVHVNTQKGKGWAPAEEHPNKYHGVGPYDPESGVIFPQPKSFSAVFGDWMCEAAAKDETLCAVTAAMTDGTGLSGFSEKFPTRLFDVGIAEGHAVSMAAGLASQGMKPVFAVYSTFLQRGYDMLIHDTALSAHHVVFAVDRAGLVGRDGETHQGSFDVAYLSSVPNMKILAPSSFAELTALLDLAVNELSGPVAVRYPRGGEGRYTAKLQKAPSVLLRSGSDVTIVCYGILLNQVLDAADALEKAGISAEIIKVNIIHPIDITPILASVKKTKRLLVPEDVCAPGSVGTAICALLAERGETAKTRLINLGNGIVPHGSVAELQQKAGLDAPGLARAALQLCAEDENA